jgi:O-antigen/teichoic acid export membrane protein
VALAIQPLVNAQFDRRYFAILLWSELALGGTVFGATTLLEATERVFEASRIRVAAAVNRLAAVSIFAWRSNWGLSDWVLLHLGFNALAVVATIAVLSSRLGVKTRPSVVPLREVRRGVALAGNQVATQGQSDADKLVLSMYRRDYDLGVYAAGYRVATLAALPLNTLLGITYGRFFVAGATSQLQARRLAIRMTKLGLLVTIPTSIILIIGAPLVPVVLGDDYAGSVVVIRVLAILPVVKSLQEFAGNALTGANRQGLRVRIVTTGLVVNVALNVALVPIWGWKAAAAGTFVAEIGVAAAFWRKVLD